MISWAYQRKYFSFICMNRWHLFRVEECWHNPVIFPEISCTYTFSISHSYLLIKLWAILPKELKESSLKKKLISVNPFKVNNSPWYFKTNLFCAALKMLFNKRSIENGSLNESVYKMSYLWLATSRLPSYQLLITVFSIYALTMSLAELLVTTSS